MIWLFEDDEKSPMSKLLSYIVPVTVDFAKGNRNIRNRLKGYCGQSVVCFVDCVLDNPDTVTLYETLSAEFGDVVFVKIPCIEYFAFILLRVCGIYILPNDVSDKIMWYTLNGSITDDYVYFENSFERYVKRLMEVEPKCLNTSGRKGRGKFYYLNCMCDDARCDVVDGDITLEHKGIVILSWLPVRVSGGILQRSGLWDDIYRRIDEVCLINIRNKEEK